VNHKTTRAERTAAGELTMSELLRREHAARQRQHVAVSCARCDWQTSGPLAEARAAHASHRRSAHSREQHR